MGLLLLRLLIVISVRNWLLHLWFWLCFQQSRLKVNQNSRHFILQFLIRIPRNHHPWVVPQLAHIPTRQRGFTRNDHSSLLLYLLFRTFGWVGSIIPLTSESLAHTAIVYRISFVYLSQPSSISVGRIIWALGESSVYYNLKIQSLSDYDHFSDPVAFFVIFSTQKVGSAPDIPVFSLNDILCRTSSTRGCFGGRNRNVVISLLNRLFYGETQMEIQLKRIQAKLLGSMFNLDSTTFEVNPIIVWVIEQLEWHSWYRSQDWKSIQGLVQCQWRF